MRNKIDLTLSPDVLFLNPWVDPGFRLLLEPEFIWRPRPRAVIEGFAVSAHEQINRKIENFLKVTKQQKTFDQAIEYSAVPVMLDRVSFRKSAVLARDRLVLSGASGTRLLNRYKWENEGQDFDPEERLKSYFSQCQKNNVGKDIPVYSGMLEPDICFAVECRNTFNFYHFVTESLSQLALLDDLDFQGNIYFHFPNKEDKQRPFAMAFVEALFPEYVGRVFFERAPKDYNKVLTAYDLLGGHFQAPPAQFAGLEKFAPRDRSTKNDLSDFLSLPILGMNSVSSALIALRRRALKAVAGGEYDHLPRRFFVGRDARQSRARHMEGEDLLFEHLQIFGFEYVVFENLEPLEQVALMARAEMMISYHGAGFTNMLFANPNSVVIEIGTLQTAQFRWGDFWPLAHTAQCKYVTFFGDFNKENRLLEPNFAEDGIVPVALSEDAIGQVMGFVVGILGQFPQLSRAKDLMLVTRRLFQVSAYDQALGLLDAHRDMVLQNTDLCLLQADCHKKQDETKSELVALDNAFKADPSRWQTLVRMIWCANHCDRPQVIRWALARLQVDFPDRHAAFLNNHEWVRYVA